MFNAIFGNFLFSRTAQPEPQAAASQAAVEASTQTAMTASMSTQTSNNEPVYFGCDPMPTEGVKPKQPEEWVIVDPSLELAKDSARSVAATEDKGCQGEDNLVEMQESAICTQPAITQSATTQSDAVVVDEEEDDDDDVMLGSFFDKHAACEDGSYDVKMAKSSVEEDHEEDIAEEFEEKSQVKEEVEEPTITKEEETWLITPLPCLTSITSSQRSIVENGTLENLLIEHPSMSIFMSATQSASASSIHGDEDEAIYEADYQAHRKLEQKQKQKQAGKKDELRQQIQAKKAAVAAVQLTKPVVIAPLVRIEVFYLM